MKRDKRESKGTARRFEPHAPGERADDANAFFPDPGDGPARAPEDLAETLAEEVVQAATTGEDGGEDQLDATFPEEIGGPFVETSAAAELADGVDEVNPPDAEREPLPRPVAGLVEDPTIEEHLDGAEAADETDAAAPASPDPEPGLEALNEPTRGARRTS